MEISKVTLLNGKSKFKENTQYSSIYLTELEVNLYYLYYVRNAYLTVFRKRLG